MVMQQQHPEAAHVGIGAYDTAEALEWGVTGPGLRATGLNWDLRKQRPYGGYDQFEFDVPTATNGDCYDRCVVRVEEMRQSLKIIRQCLDNMPAGPYKATHPLTTPPPKERTMHDIETLIQHFLNVSWGPVIPAGECSMMIEATKGWNSLLPRLRRQHDVVPHPHPHAVVPASADDSADQPRTDGGRSDRHPREHRLRDGRRGPLK